MRAILMALFLTPVLTEYAKAAGTFISASKQAHCSLKTVCDQSEWLVAKIVLQTSLQNTQYKFNTTLHGQFDKGTSCGNSCHLVDPIGLPKTQHPLVPHSQRKLSRRMSLNLL